MEKDNATSGASKDTSGSKDSKETTVTDTSGSTDSVVSKLKTEKENWKTKALALETKVKDAETKALQETNNFKELYEKANNELKAKDDKIQLFELKEKNAKLDKAIERELVKFGVVDTLLDDAKKLFDKDSIAIDSDTGAVYGAEESAKKFYEKYQTIFFKRKDGAHHAAARVNLGNGKADFSNAKTPDEVMAAWKAAKGR